MINLKNKLWIILILLLIIGIIIFIFFNNNNKNDNKAENNYETSRTSTNDTSKNSNETTKNELNEVSKNVVEIQKNATGLPNQKEEEIATFSTKIYTKDSSRQNNINITCSTLNDTIVSNGSVFSFCDTVGQATTSKGYQKADIFDKDGNKKKGLGGRKLSS